LSSITATSRHKKITINYQKAKNGSEEDSRSVAVAMAVVRAAVLVTTALRAMLVMTAEVWFMHRCNKK
jgi:hypothetical protein